MFIELIKRDLLLTYRQPTTVLNLLLFFIMVVSLFPLATSPDPKLLQAIAAGVIWVGALLAMMLGLDRLFYDDYRDGTLEQFLLSSRSLFVLVIAKVFTHWLLTGLPLILAAPLLGVILHMSMMNIAILTLSLLLGTPILSLIGSIVAALTVSLRQNGVLLSLLVLPLCVPVLIFAASTVVRANLGLPIMGQLALLGALLFLSLSLAPLATIAALRICDGSN